MKLISDLKLGDKVFVIFKSSHIFDVAEVIELLNNMIRFQCYLTNEIFYLWKYQEYRHENVRSVLFTDENEAIEEFKSILNHN